MSTTLALLAIGALLLNSNSLSLFLLDLNKADC